MTKKRMRIGAEKIEELKIRWGKRKVFGDFERSVSLIKKGGTGASLEAWGRMLMKTRKGQKERERTNRGRGKAGL